MERRRRIFLEIHVQKEEAQASGRRRREPKGGKEACQEGRKSGQT